MGATMRDVARQAGVSVATVSRALSGSARVAPDIRERVAQAARDLHYVPSRLPANLRAKLSRNLALVVGNVRNPYFPDLIGGCEEAAQRAGYSLVIGDSDEDQDRESAILEHLAAERVAGVVLASAGETTNGLRQLVALGTPIVAVDRRLEGLYVDTVTVDNEDAARRAVRHLVDLGHRRIGMISGPTSLSSIRDRQAGYVHCLREAGIPSDASLVVYGDLRESTAAQLLPELLNRPDPPTAILTANNLASVGALRALRARGIDVPRQMSVVGFDDLPTGDLMDPPLTAVVQPTHNLGRTAMELLLRRLGAPDAPVRDVVLDTTFVVRGSTAPPLTFPARIAGVVETASA